MGLEDNAGREKKVGRTIRWEMQDANIGDTILMIPFCAYSATSTIAQYFRFPEDLLVLKDFEIVGASNQNDHWHGWKYTGIEIELSSG